jgi:hypothetical protein
MRTFQTTLERAGEEIPVQVEYGVSSDELFINCVTPSASVNTAELLTTVEENDALHDEANAHFWSTRH